MNSKSSLQIYVLAQFWLLNSRMCDSEVLGLFLRHRGANFQDKEFLEKNSI